ncbi:thiamine diphosphate-binding protein [Glomus cerebriforme]|uniref:Thiamine diphosphate-binding protein n=1 Tax=Glomus cerebriforme TaxID=658196 RepID=A0A397SM38_9GLOM|nr:thiamine diphosphate-binding protein [Glomus cerebriforme]
MSYLAVSMTRPINFGIAGIIRTLNRPIINSKVWKQNSRNYHDNEAFGYRVPVIYTMQDYTNVELSNRIENANLLRLVAAYRTYGHKEAHLDPLGIMEREKVLALDYKRYGFTEPNKVYNLNGILHVNKSSSTKDSKEEANIDAIISHLKKVYCGKVAYEFMHIPNASERRWFYHTLESYDKTSLTPKEKKRIFEFLTRSEVFDHFMSKKFPQVKRYGLEGAESMLVALEKLFEVSNKAGVIEAVLCMPHRGRLNLLTDLLKFPPVRLFHKVKGNPEFPEHLPASGDVLSHLASSPQLNYGATRPLNVSMLHNPSHLEAVNPVAMGKTRAKQMDLLKFETDCKLGDRVMCIQLHGDAAFTGQGVVMESFGLSNLPHFSSGGSVHIVVNNQLGYTTPAQNARSSWYSSDIGKMINAPVIHVNGDFPEDVTRAIEIAFEYRNKFEKDVIIDLITYRRWGHNELDEPAYTQPLMYNNIRSRKSVPKLYEEKLLTEEIITRNEINEFRDNYFKFLEEQYKLSDDYKSEADTLKKKWSKMIMPTESVSKLDTGVSRDVLEKVGKISITVPDDIVIHPRLKKFHIQSRLQRIAEGKKIDWATAEALALGSLLLEGHNVRLCGQDVGRGTFSQRHAMMICQETERVVIPLNNLSKDQGMLEVANSNLSELAVVGFEYGMSIENPNNLNLWEAQFGDFFNGAQIIIDTYISSGEAKWLRQSGLVMLLPHGYDGAGPEHSSCRIERFLQLSNDRIDVLNDIIPINPNMHIINPTTPAQYFHALRRQLKRNFRKPLIVMTPKILLKSAAAVSDFEEMMPSTTFLPVIGNNTISEKSKIEKIIFVCGKLYYDLVKERQNKKLVDKVAIVRIEELCPFPKKDIEQELNNYNNVEEFVWCQEEPQNNGAFTFIEPRLNQILPNGQKVKYVGRPTSATPAVGVSKWHHIEHSKILNEIF